jgi:hypothetical protein
MTTSAVLDHLRARGLVVRERRRGALAQCPAHEDRRPSLDVTTGRDGRTLMLCRSGCRTADVLAAVGLRLGDLFDGINPCWSVRIDAPRSPIEWARHEAEALAHQQAWTRHRERYAAADAILAADRVRRAAREDDADVWATLAEAAALTTAAENVLAGEP